MQSLRNIVNGPKINN